MNTGPAAQSVWESLGLGVRFTWSSVAYEVTSWPEQDGPSPDVCQMRRIGKGGKLWGPLRRFTFEHCLIELPEILRGKDDA